MIKFFRSIRQNLLSEGKIGKYLKYAVGEIVLVMIGILLALQVNNWNENRKVRQEEHLALKSLQKEFLESQELFEQSQRHNKMIFSSMKYLLHLLDTDQVEESLADSIYVHLDRSAWSSAKFEPSRGIVNSLVNSGKLNIISNDTLKSQLIQWNDQVTGFQNSQRMALDYRFTYLFPLISKSTRLPSKLKRSVEGYTLNVDGPPDVDLSILKSNMFYNYLNQSWVYSQVIVVNDSNSNKGSKIQETIDDIILHIQKELEKQ